MDKVKGGESRMDAIDGEIFWAHGEGPEEELYDV
jgi:hypothetical protein